MMPPCAVDNPILTVRKFTRRYALEDLVAIGSVTQQTAAYLADAIAAERNLLISGSTGTGKTTLLNALAARIPHPTCARSVPKAPPADPAELSGTDILHLWARVVVAAVECLI
jgi:Flp pilus assembly CpaF family ATPase